MKGAGWMRNVLYIDFIEWVNCFEEIFLDWDAGNYEILFPPEVHYPLQLTRLMTNQLTAIREKETELGTDKHKVLDDSIEEDRIKRMAFKSTTSSNNNTAGEAKTDSPSKPEKQKNKYVTTGAAAAAIGAGAAALNSVVSES